MLNIVVRDEVENEGGMNDIANSAELQEQPVHFECGKMNAAIENVELLSDDNFSDREEHIVHMDAQVNENI